MWEAVTVTNIHVPKKSFLRSEFQENWRQFRDTSRTVSHCCVLLQSLLWSHILISSHISLRLISILRHKQWWYSMSASRKRNCLEIWGIFVALSCQSLIESFRHDTDYDMIPTRHDHMTTLLHSHSPRTVSVLWAAMLRSAAPWSRRPPWHPGAATPQLLSHSISSDESHESTIWVSEYPLSQLPSPHFYWTGDSSTVQCSLLCTLQYW